MDLVTIMIAGIFSGVIPVMSGIISGILKNATLAAWSAGLSPIVMPFSSRFTS